LFGITLSGSHISHKFDIPIFLIGYNERNSSYFSSFTYVLMLRTYRVDGKHQ